MTSRNMGLRLTVLLWLAASGMAQASETPAESTMAPQSQRQGEITRLWLDRQRDGGQAAAQAQSLPGPIMEQIYERYRKSFAHSIPEHFEREQIVSRGATR